MTSSHHPPTDLPSVLVTDLTYKAGFGPVLLENINLDLPPGSRCLLCGANGAGKTTLLQVLAGKHMVPPSAVQILGRPAFHDLSLGADPARRDRLLRLLDIDLEWTMLSASDGQRRRVQIAMGLLLPYKVLLLDEITVDMDVLGRLDLLHFFKQECEERGASIVYATHIFDGLEGWPTHLAYMEGGKVVKGGLWAGIHELEGGQRLLATVEQWLLKEKKERRAAMAAGGCKQDALTTAAKQPAPMMPSRHMAYFR
uniref:ABC transporter domain-containing protein n=1 Tax=Auxenochlorella protothecoides TaxID=3075 RepID=A0A1D1ZRQ9_AUXPR